MKLYHGTSNHNLNKILKAGFITPRNNKGNWRETVMSNDKMVYLTNSYACYFAFNTAKGLASDDPNWKAEDFDDSKAVVLELDVSIKNLYPDEDYLEQSTRDADKHDDLDMIVRTKEFRGQYKNYKDKWKDSLNGLGTVCHEGAIPITKITRIAVLKESVFLNSQPTITLKNQKYLGEQYHHECKNLIWTDQYADQIIKSKKIKRSLCL
tara:strand:+ start:94 stop:720 length:627 start_codon:yes stop_codon:yes gene_type:complete